MTSPTREPLTDPTSFKVATIATLLLPVAGLAFMLLMFSIAPQGAEGLGPILLGIAIFALSIPLTIILLVITASASAISNRKREPGVQVTGQVEAAAPRTTKQPELDEDDEDDFTIPRPVFIGIVIVAALPLLAGIAALLGLLHA